MSREELQEWESFDAIEPIGKAEQRIEYMIGALCALISNTVQQLYGKKGSNTSFVQPTDFVPQWGVFTDEIEEAKEKKQSPEEMKQFLLGMAKVQNAKQAKHPEERRRRKEC
ncbi:MAG: hypothetical protein EOM62_20595 [Bacteroidia bacterium]|nr:hypothetical protein [Bacteroidia bacterium]